MLGRDADAGADGIALAPELGHEVLELGQSIRFRTEKRIAVHGA